MNDRWYEPVALGSPLDQGDLLPDCPVVRWKDGASAFEGNEPLEQLRSKIEAAAADVIVMTQTCDLAQGKARYVILCPHFPLSTIKSLWQKQQIDRNLPVKPNWWARFLDNVVAGQVWHLSMLNQEQTAEYDTDIRIVDFHEVYSLPRAFLDSWLATKHPPRLRLRPPYREHLSQAFARFFMRVGLPTDVAPVWHKPAP